MSDKEVEEAWANILNQTHFVQGGELVQEVRKKVVMLGSDRSFELLSSNATHIFGDGTFRFAPNHYKHMFTVHIIKDNIYVHVAYFLLKNKQQITYQIMFEMLRDKCPNFSPQTAHFDFEVAIHKAFHQVFPAAEVRGCRFHLAQAWYRKLASLGLQVTYLIGKSKTAIWLKTCFGLPCLPCADVYEFFQAELTRERPAIASLDTFSNYLVNTYLAPNSLFPPHLWAGCLNGDFLNTTNGCENFHRHFGIGCLNPHPSIYDWLVQLQLTHKRNMIKSVGTNKPNKKSALLNAHLLGINQKFQSNEIDTMTFVKLASLNCIPKSTRMVSTRSKSIISSIKKKYSIVVKRVLKTRKM